MQRFGFLLYSHRKAHTEFSVAERSFSLLDRVQMLIKPMAQPLLRNGR